MAECVKKAIGSVTHRKMARLHWAFFHVCSNRHTPDLDSAYHQVQDMLTKDAWGISDENVSVRIRRRKPLVRMQKPGFIIMARYDIEFDTEDKDAH